jgi:hypothetical protein
MANQTSPGKDSERVVRFRPRGASGWRWAPQQQTPAEPPVANLAKFQQAEGEDDYRHRMTMNGLALLVTTLLVIVGVWLASSIAEMVKNQDCFLQGRRNCETIIIPRRDEG